MFLWVACVVYFQLSPRIRVTIPRLILAAKKEPIIPRLVFDSLLTRYCCAIAVPLLFVIVFRCGGELLYPFQRDDDIWRFACHVTLALKQTRDSLLAAIASLDLANFCPRYVYSNRQAVRDAEEEGGADREGAHLRLRGLQHQGVRLALHF